MAPTSYAQGAALSRVCLANEEAMTTRARLCVRSPHTLYGIYSVRRNSRTRHGACARAHGGRGRGCLDKLGRQIFRSTQISPRGERGDVRRGARHKVIRFLRGDRGVGSGEAETGRYGEQRVGGDWGNQGGEEWNAGGEQTSGR